MSVALDTVKPYLIQGHSYDVRPRYVVYGGLLFQRDLFRQHPGLSHDAKPHRIASRDEGIAGPFRQRFVLTLKSLQLPFQPGLGNLLFGKLGKPGHSAPR